MHKKLQISKNLEKVMKISCIQLLLATLMMSISWANDGKAQDLLNTKVTVSFQNQDIETVLEKIGKKADARFMYSPELIQADRKVNFEANNEKLSVVLDNLLKPLKLTYQVLGKQIVLKRLTETIQSLQGKELNPNVGTLDQSVSGKVTAENGEELPGVSILLKGTQRGTTTNTSGQYKINVPDAKSVLVFSFVGYVAQEVVVGNQSMIDVKMVSEDRTLKEVVVVGYGTQSRKNLTSAITTIKPEDLNRGAITDVGQLLQGKVPGLNISASGDPNRPAAVVLRGASTINSSQGPLYVIDGIPGADIAAIAPDDIASIDVLKDAAATAIYGNRAANGVIMVTTKRGKKGEMQVSYHGYVGIENVSSKLNMMDATQLRAFLTQNGQAFSPNDDKNANTNWQEAVQRSSATSQNHNLSFSGGTEHGTYSASLNYADKQGILQASSLTRFIARLAIEQYALNGKLKFGLSVTNSNSNANNTPLRNNVLAQMINHLPVSPVQNPDGSYFENFTSTGYFNPVALINHAQDNSKFNALIGSFTTQATLQF